MATEFCRDCRAHRPVGEFSEHKRSRDGLAFRCRAHLAERAARSREARRVRPRTHRFPPVGLEVPDGHEWCPDCDVVKPLEDFPRTAASRSGRATYCLPCHNARGKASKNKVGGSRTYHLARRYGISADEADLVLEAQGGVCAICRSAPAVHVDHDHRTGRVRALLCSNCTSPAARSRRTASGRVGCPPVGSGWRVVRVASAPRETYVERAAAACRAVLREAAREADG